MKNKGKLNFKKINPLITINNDARSYLSFLGAEVFPLSGLAFTEELSLGAVDSLAGAESLEALGAIVALEELLESVL